MFTYVFLLSQKQAYLNSPTSQTNPSIVYASTIPAPTLGWDNEYIKKCLEEEKEFLQEFVYRLNDMNSLVTKFLSAWAQQSWCEDGLDFDKFIKAYDWEQDVC